MFGGLKKKLEKAAMSKIIAIVLKKIAEGDFGSGPKAAYDWLAGKKTYLGIGFGALATVLHYLSTSGVCPPCASWNNWVLSISGFLVSIGLIDGALRTEPPKPQ